MKNKWNYVVIALAIFISLFICFKVGNHSSFWMDDKGASLFSHVPSSAIPFFIHITALGDKIGIGVVALLFLAWLLLFKRSFLGAAVLALSVALGNEVSKLLKDWFVRPRPELEHLVEVKSYSFPSGHAMVSIILYTITAYFLIEAANSKQVKWMIGVIAALFVFMIGVSRLILQVHFPSDVIGGYALGYIWVSIWIFLYNYFKPRLTRKRG